MNRSYKVPTKMPEEIICSNCKLEQWSGYDVCQKCGAQFIEGEHPIATKQARTSMVMGLTALAFAVFIFLPGLLSALSCVGPIAGLFAFISGIKALRTMKQGEEKSRNEAVIGLVLAGIGIVVFILVIGSAVIAGRNLATDLFNP
jgi:hypothetical protein